METTAKSMKIQCNEPTYNLLREPSGSSRSFATTKRLVDGKHGIKVKGKGLQVGSNFRQLCSSFLYFCASNYFEVHMVDY